jgi:hypothetical protein
VVLVVASSVEAEAASEDVVDVGVYRRIVKQVFDRAMIGIVMALLSALLAVVVAVEVVVQRCCIQLVDVC